MGLKLTHRNPPENIWTFAAAFSENYFTDHKDSLCPCINPAPPSEVGSNYVCYISARNRLGKLEGLLLFVRIPVGWSWL